MIPRFRVRCCRKIGRNSVVGARNEWSNNLDESSISDAEQSENVADAVLQMLVCVLDRGSIFWSCQWGIFVEMSAVLYILIYQVKGEIVRNNSVKYVVFTQQ